MERMLPILLSRGHRRETAAPMAARRMMAMSAILLAERGHSLATSRVLPSLQLWHATREPRPWAGLHTRTSSGSLHQRPHRRSSPA